MPALPLTRDVKLHLIRERLTRGDYESLDMARLVAQRLLRDGFPGNAAR